MTKSFLILIVAWMMVGICINNVSSQHKIYPIYPIYPSHYSMKWKKSESFILLNSAIKFLNTLPDETRIYGYIIMDAIKGYVVIYPISAVGNKK